MNIRTVALATLFISSNAFAWSVPLHNASYDPGPHPAGQTIDCTYTNDDGQVFNGTITSDPNGGFSCSGFAVQDDDDTIAAEAALAERESPGGGCEVLDAGYGEVEVECAADEGRVSPYSYTAEGSSFLSIR